MCGRIFPEESDEVEKYAGGLPDNSVTIVYIESKLKDTPIADDNMSTKISPNDPIVQSVYIYEKLSSYVGAAGGSKPVPCKAKENFLPLFSDNLCEGAKPIMLDSDTSSMCIESWENSSFARCLIEINADDVLKESLTIGVPLIEGSGFTIEFVNIKYEWKPPCCDLCKIFGHVHDYCHKKVLIPNTVVTPNVLAPTTKKTNPTPSVGKTNDGFQTVAKKKKKKYKPQATTSAPKKGATNVGNASQSSSMLKKQPTTTITSTKECNITMSNSYAALDDESEDDVKNVYDELANLFCTKTGESSSTFTAAAS
ncbi:zinc knuckle CX2CX4HX4C containing protein [Tanacetum coccineum]